MSDYIIPVKAYLEKGKPLVAADLAIKLYAFTNFDKTILEKIITDLNKFNLYEKAGELLEIMKEYKRAIESYRKAKCFSKANELAKKNGISDIKKLDEEKCDYLCGQDLQSKEEEVKALIKDEKLEKAIELLNRFPNMNPKFYLLIGKYYESKDEYNKAEEYYIKGGEPAKAFNMYAKLINISENQTPDNNDTVNNQSIFSEYRQFFEQIQNEKNQFNEEEIKLITQKFIEFRNIFFNSLNKIKVTIKEQNKCDKNDKEINNIYNKVIIGQINKNEMNEKIIFELIELGKSTDDMEKILKLCQNLYQLLNLIHSKFNYIYIKYAKENKYIKIDEIMDIETNSLEKIKEIHEIILEQEKEKNYYLIKFEALIIKHINFYQNRDIDNLLLLKEMINNHKKYGDELKALNKKIQNNIKDTAFYLIKEKRLNSRETIDLILNIGIKNFEYKEKELFNSINISELNENDYPQFCKIWDNIFGNEHIIDLLIRIILKKIESLKDYGIIFKIIPDYLINYSIAKELEEKVKLLLYYTINIKSCINIIDDIYNTIKIFESINYPSINFLKFIEDNGKLSIKMISELYLRIIQDEKLNSNKELNNLAITFLIQRNLMNNINSIDLIIKIINTSNKNLIDLFLNSIKNYVISENDFFNLNTINKFKLYIIIYPRFQEYNNSDYFLYSNKALNNVYKKIINLDLNYEEFMKLTGQIGNKNFQEKLIAFNLCKNEPDQETKIYKIINETKVKLYALKERLSKLEIFYKTFFDIKRKNYLKEIENQNKIFKTRNIKSILISLSDFLKNSNTYKSYKNYFKLIESKLFLALYLNNKSQENYKDQDNLFEKSIKDFLKLTELNNLNQELNINKIPFKDIIVKEIKK